MFMNNFCNLEIDKKKQNSKFTRNIMTHGGSDYYDKKDRIKETKIETEEQIQERQKRLEQRIEISVESKRDIWQHSPTHPHDSDFFNSDKTNPFGRLKYDQDEKKKSSVTKQKK